MAILRQITKEKNFTVICNNLLQNEDLTYEAKGLLIELLSRPKNWIIHKSQLIREHTGATKINRIFKELKEKGYLHIHTLRDDKKIIGRYWIASEIPMNMYDWYEYIQKLNNRKPYVKDELFKEDQELQNKDSLQSTDLIQNKDISNSKNELPTPTNGRFKKPTLQEVKQYCNDRNNTVDCERFIDFYESKGWMIGKNKMKDWRAAIRTWERNGKTESIIPEFGTAG